MLDRLPRVSFIHEHKWLSAALGVAVAAIVSLPMWVEPTWALFSNDPLFPVLARSVPVTDWRVGDVLAYLPSAVSIILLVGLYVRSWAKPLGGGEPLSPSASSVQRKPIRIPDGSIVWEERRRSNYMVHPVPAAFCAEHQNQELWARILPDRYYAYSKQEIVRTLPPRTKGEWVPYCLTGEHDVPVSGSIGFQQAQSIAQGLIEAKQHELREA